MTVYELNDKLNDLRKTQNQLKSVIDAARNEPTANNAISRTSNLNMLYVLEQAKKGLDDYIEAITAVTKRTTVDFP